MRPMTDQSMVGKGDLACTKEAVDGVNAPTMQTTDHDATFMCIKHVCARTHTHLLYSPLYVWSIHEPYTFFLACCTCFCKEQLCFDHKFGV
jgi:hypothetical protein